MMDPIETVKPKDSTTLIAAFTLKTGSTHYIIRIQNANGFFREDTVYSSPAEVKSLTPYTEYSLSIMAENSGGRSQPTLPVTAKTGNVLCHIIFTCVQNVRFSLVSISTAGEPHKLIQWKHPKAGLCVEMSHTFIKKH